MTAAVTAAALAAHASNPAASPALTLLLGGLATGMCFVVAEQSWVRWRLVGDAVCARMCVAFVIYGGVVVPFATTHADGPGGALGQTLGTIATAVVLLSTLAAPEVDSRARFMTPTLVTLGAAVCAVLVVPATPGLATHLGRLTVLDQPLLEVVPAAFVGVAAVAAAAAGLRLERRVLTRCGAAFGLFVAAPAVTAGPMPPAAPLLTAAVHVGALLLVVPVAVTDTRLAIRSVGRANTLLRHRWLDAVAHADCLTRDDVERRHELRSALVALEGASDALRRDVEHLGKPDDAALAGAVAAELRRLHGLVADHGATTRQEYAVGEALAPTVVARRACGQRIDLLVAPGLRAVGNPAVLAEAVGNLLANADVHAPGSHVVITAAHDADRQVRVLVVDDGATPGASAAVEPRPGHHAAPGTHGIGLAIATRLVRDQGGDLTILSTPGRHGTTVAVDIPTRSSGERTEEAWRATAS